MIVVLLAASGVNRGDIKNLGSFFLLFFHFFVLLLASVFLITSLVRYDAIPQWFMVGTLVESGINALALGYLGLSAEVFAGAVILVPVELLPFVLFFLKKKRLSSFSSPIPH